MTEEAILHGCLKNDATAQRELYNRYSPKMLAVCYRFAHNREDAEDMLQEGFIKVFTQIHTFENRGAFEGWIRRIIVHTCINILKKNKKFNESVDLIHATGVQVREDSVPAIIQAKQVVECIRLLPMGYRTQWKGIVTGKLPRCWISKKVQAGVSIPGPSPCWKIS